MRPTTAAGRGGSPEPILREFGLERSSLIDPEGFIVTAKLALLSEDTARATGDDFFGLHFGEGFNPKNIGPVVYVVLNSPTISAGIENVERYLKITTKQPDGLHTSRASAPTWDTNWRNWALQSRANTRKPAW